MNYHILILGHKSSKTHISTYRRTLSPQRLRVTSHNAQNPYHRLWRTRSCHNHLPPHSFILQFHKLLSNNHNPPLNTFLHPFVLPTGPTTGLQSQKHNRPPARHRDRKSSRPNPDLYPFHNNHPRRRYDIIPRDPNKDHQRRSILIISIPHIQTQDLHPLAIRTRLRCHWSRSGLMSLRRATLDPPNLTFSDLGRLGHCQQRDFHVFPLRACLGRR